MDRIIRKKNKNYCTISNVFLRDKNLSLKAKGLLAQVMSLPSDWNFTIDGLCSIVKEGADAIYSAIKELKESGYCKYEQLRENGKICGSNYTFYEEPYRKNPDVENPYTENPNEEKPNGGNSIQINKEYNKVQTKTSSSEDKNIKSDEEVVLESKKKAVAKTKSRTLSSAKKTLQERQHEFGLTLTPYLDINGGPYPKEMIRAFFNYWTEPNKSQTKMRFELERTWEVGRRLTTWANNNKNFGNRQNNINNGRETITDKIRRTAENAEDFINRIRAQREANMGNGNSQ